MLVIAGNIGATKVQLALTDVQPGTVEVLKRIVVPRESWRSISVMLAHFCAEWQGDPEAICLSVPGTVNPDQTCHIRPIGSPLDAQRLSSQLGLPVKLIFDCCATARGVDLLQPEEIVTLRAGKPNPDAVQAVLCVGMGFGAAMRVPCGGSYTTFPTRAGLVDFAAINGLQQDLRSYLERVHCCKAHLDLILGEQGLQDIFRFRGGIDEDGFGEEPRTILEGARNRSNPLYSETVRWFKRLYGQIAGNLALTLSSTGGVYLSGGMSVNIAWAIDREFFDTFNDHGGGESWLADIPIYLLLNESAPLLGAASLALE